MKYSRVFFLLGMLCLLLSFQIIKTTLTVTVRDELGNLVQGATVQLFEKQDDYNKEENVAAEGTTDAKGVLRLKDLKAISYYVIVRKDDKDNSGGGEQTGKLEAKKINKVTIIIQ
jgi:hypothetical protein